MISLLCFHPVKCINKKDEVWAVSQKIDTKMTKGELNNSKSSNDIYQEPILMGSCIYALHATADFDAMIQCPGELFSSVNRKNR